MKICDSQIKYKENFFAKNQKYRIFKPSLQTVPLENG